MMKLSSSISSILFLNFNSPSIISHPSSKFPTNLKTTMTYFPKSSIHCSNSSPAIPAEEPQVAPPKTMPRHPWLIVGLGNPGKKYIGTRHNVGFEMVDAIAESEGISITGVNFKSLLGKGFIGNVPVMLAKPQTFMNLSGESVGAIVSYYKIPLKQVLVIYDDLDLPFAKLRLLPKGGHGGHNGMRSIVDRLKGSRDFPRLRIGIGRPPGKMDAVNFVLRPFNRQEREELEFTFQHGTEAIQILLLEGFDKSATFVNSAKAIEQLG
ncbi:Peptidyl-tRNA hydrolase [Hibiscus syriacus]|uniref:peptidyl-tRNA hydrolase n=1 Tax=Hibiscus syriacus TaxID=106335 RepID=A0A6A3C9Z9_HIBSY|nr:peptidyl-tRNA hydrolase, chloroplastic-like [Hibiscus syriacus]XP_039060608.1 peptidyl-tRNA hydrolase, chloroplastic-like [Hibiscus syriacus]XP_039060609.1 peptidyl-tRNA hydrolase, chloroplastic-like [Hibiscus syriacus]XP_039060610.1 peptidyl-tRNA hydrolase, chloroplastic-like [Hibiscus syriacus]XP_039060611.1 peptidyl-tRNA hydrolase, chloroplastic-like [Hibiscus syriacus]KAE8724012.1 Peptidyl-tRNA hydrolase [Hibiscus syriacus]